jgi:nucleoside-diphosphate-sugar epimerase
MSWIHIDDLVDLIITALRQSKFRGVYNGTAPNPVRMHEMCSSLGAVMRRPSWLPVPEFALQVRLAVLHIMTCWACVWCEASTLGWWQLATLLATPCLRMPGRCALKRKT